MSRSLNTMRSWEITMTRSTNGWFCRGTIFMGLQRPPLVWRRTSAVMPSNTSKPMRHCSGGWICRLFNRDRRQKSSHAMAGIHLGSKEGSRNCSFDWIGWGRLQRRPASFQPAAEFIRSELFEAADGWSRSTDCCDALQLRPCSRFQQKHRHLHRMPHLLDCLSEENILEKAVAVGGHGNQVNLALS